jgi:peptidoglycan/LPS O-acetylase OafA/YrhL
LVVAPVAEVDEPGITFLIRGRHLAGLDGLRGIAVMAVVAYHLGWHPLSGGYLSLDLFFALSGFLITSLLIEERMVAGATRLIKFWGRRAKRLLPALFVMLAVVALYLVVIARLNVLGGASVDPLQFRGDALSSIFYVANWHLIATSQSYFALYSAPSPIQHTWSLSIEEQFYLVFPFLAIGMMARTGSRWRRSSIVILTCLAVGSLIAMAVEFVPGFDPSRVYFGTDTRAFDLLFGSALAFLTAGRATVGDRGGRRLEVFAWLAAAVLGVFWIIAGTPAEVPRNYMYYGGFGLCSLLAVVVIANVSQRPQGPMGRCFSARPLVAMGLTSYGIYLWHWPVIDLLTPSTTGLGPLALLTLRLGLIAILTLASYSLLECPLRRWRWTRLQSWIAIPGAFILTSLLVVLLTIPSLSLPAPPKQVSGVPEFSGTSGHVPGAGGFGSQVRIRLGHRVSPARPLRIGFMGDSVVAFSYPGLRSSLVATGEVTTSSMAESGWGLDSPLVAPPWAEIPEYLAGAHPQIIIGSWAQDDEVAATQPRQYFKTLTRLMTALTKGPNAVRGVILMTWPTASRGGILPSTATVEENELSAANARAWDAVVRRVEARFPGKLMLLPVSDAVLLAGGRYSTWLPPANDPTLPYAKWTRVRKTDGVHLCQFGAARYSAALLSDVQQLFGVGSARSGWWDEAWRSSPLFNQLEIGQYCPADHPPAGTTPQHPATPTGS